MPLAPVYSWCPMCVGCDASSMSLGWSLLPSSVLIVLALVNSNIPHWGDLGIPTRPGSATSLPDSTTSTGLLCLSVGARVHCGRSNIEVDCARSLFFLLLCKRPFVCKLLFLVFMQDAPCLVCWFSRSFVSEACTCFWGMFVRGCARRDLC